jgi:hypothetical protein
MLRNRDSLTQSRPFIILELRQEIEGRDEIFASLARTVQNAERPYPELYWQRMMKSKGKLMRLRRILRDEAREKARKIYYVLSYRAGARNR